MFAKKRPEEMGFMEKDEYSSWAYAEEFRQGPRFTTWLQYMIKIIGQLAVIGVETVLVVMSIVPTLIPLLFSTTPSGEPFNNTNTNNNISSNNNNNSNSYFNPMSNNSNSSINSTANMDENLFKYSAISFLAFYALGAISMTIYWCCVCVKKRYPLGAVLFLAFFCEMPAIICEVPE